MISVNDFKTGLTIVVDGVLYRVLDFQHVKPGKGAAFVRSKLRNLRNGNVTEKTFRAGEKVEKAMIENRKMQYLYAQGDEHVFMDLESYDQTTLTEGQIEYELKFLLENMEVHIQTYGGEMLGVELPNTVVLEVASLYVVCYKIIRKIYKTITIFPTAIKRFDCINKNSNFSTIK